MAISTTQVPALGANYEIITASGTWTPPVGYSVFDVIILGAGGGGAGGAYAETVTYTYGFGGAGGAAGYGLFLRGLRITAPVSVTIGTGGAGGAGAAATGGNGADGSRGGRTVFNGIIAPGGGAGRRGIADTGTTAASSANQNVQACYDEGIGTAATYIPPARHGSSVNTKSEGGSGGSAGGNVSNSGTSGTVPIRTAGGSNAFMHMIGGIYGGSPGIFALGSSIGPSSTNTFAGTAELHGGVGQGAGLGPRPTYASSGGYGGWLTSRNEVSHTGDMWWIPGGGGGGYGVGGGATAGWGEGGYAGTATAGGLHGYSTNSADTYRDGQSATDYGAGGGGGGGAYNTGFRAGNGGAGANGVVIVYWGM